MKVYLVTSSDDYIGWGVSMDVNGIFSSINLAEKWISNHKEVIYPEITEMTVDNPDHEQEGYPGVWYEE